MSNTSVNLLGTTSRVATPSIGIKIGKYIFGVYNSVVNDEDVYQINPRFVQSLDIKKINGTVNQYTLKLDYPITQKDDPNLLDKVFASVSDTRDISFSYGDLSTPSFVYKEEKAIITKVRKKTNVSSAVKSYTVSAISTGVLNTIGTYKFKKRTAKPSDVIWELLYSPKYGLTQIFFGMTDKDLVLQNKLIADDDAEVTLEAKSNITVLDYLKYLVDMMKPQTASNGIMKKSIYLLLFEDDVLGPLGGPFFKVIKNTRLSQQSTAYEIDIGFPSQNIVTDWSVEDDETYSIYYKFANSLQPNEYVSRINDRGEVIDVYAPAYASNSPKFTTTEDIKTWWTKVTEYPIKATLTFRGLLRPAVLMSYVRVGIYFYGNKDIDSGLYIVTSQQDHISKEGYVTTLSLVRVGGDDSYVD